MDVTVNSVTDQFGEAYPYEATAQDRDLIVRIGDRDRLVRGMHVYRIQYTVRHAVNFFGKLSHNVSCPYIFSYPFKTKNAIQKIGLRFLIKLIWYFTLAQLVQ